MRLKLPSVHLITAFLVVSDQIIIGVLTPWKQVHQAFEFCNFYCRYEMFITYCLFCGELYPVGCSQTKQACCLYRGDGEIAEQ